MHRIIAAEARAPYRVHVRFSDGVEGEVDLSDLVGKGVFAAWSDPERFAHVSIDPDTHTLTWPGGIDLCPDRLYQDVRAQRAAEKPVALVEGPNGGCSGTPSGPP
jgi:hypothetical protein